LAAALTAAAAALVAAVGWYMQQMKTLELAEETYHCDVGVRFEHGAGARIRLTDEGAVLADGNKTYPLGSNPVFFAREKRAVIPTAVLAVSRDGRQGRLECFSEADFSGETPVLRDGNKTFELLGGFLFDGRDTYLFLEEGTLAVGDKRHRLTPGSYAVVIHNARIDFYPRGASAGVSADINGKEVTAVLDGGYSVDLGKDILRHDNTELLLFTDPSMIAPLSAPQKDRTP
jgi:hypothetical protein